MPPDSALTAAAADPSAIAVPNRWLNALLAAMLLTLHGAIAWGAGDWWERGLMLAHVGLFLIWQPVWSGERKMPLIPALVVLCLGAVFAFAGNWWLTGIWMALLFGLIGGSAPGRAWRRDRFVAILAAVYLITMLLMWVVPQLIPNYHSMSGAVAFVRYGLLALPLVILAIPGGQRARGEPVIVDLFFSVMLFLLIIVLVLGSFVVFQVSHGAYLLGLAQTLMVIALGLVVLSWLWNPRAGFGGIGVLISQHLLGLGLPFERRVRHLADLAQAETQPEQFLHDALTSLLEMSWVTGFSWVSPVSTGQVGEQDAHVEPYAFGALQVMLYAPRPFSPAVLLHLRLLMQMVWHFYEALHREQQRQRAAYTQAIYETGARLTHDVKNLLQSLRSICAAAERRDAEDETAFRSLVQRQLPLITQRLGATLEKLKSPEAIDTSEVAATIWWQALQARYAGGSIVFQDAGELNGVRLPAELFDNVATTLIENALFKAVQDPAVQVQVRLSTGRRLQVADDGLPVPAALARQMLHAPVASDSGLGVGLFQAARYAEKCGYRLALTDNRDGAVSFELAPAD